MLRHPRTAFGGDEGGSGGDVEKLVSRAAGAAGINQVLKGRRYGRGKGSHGFRGAGNLGDRFPAQAQRHEHRRNLGLAGLAAHDGQHEIPGAFLGERFPPGQAVQVFRDGVAHEPSLPSRKFSRSVLPWGEKIDSG